MVSTIDESTNKLLKVIIALLLRRREDNTLSLREQIGVLHGFGLKPAEIADIIGRSNTYVSKELTGIRKTQNREKAIKRSKG